MIKVKAPSLEELNKLRIAFHTKIKNPRITQIQVFNYTSKTQVETFINRLSYLPLSGISDQVDYTLQFNKTGSFTGLDINQMISPFNTLEAINILNEGTFKIAIKISFQDGTLHSRFNMIERVIWDQSQVSMTLYPTINIKEEFIARQIEEIAIRNKNSVISFK